MLIIPRIKTKAKQGYRKKQKRKLNKTTQYTRQAKQKSKQNREKKREKWQNQEEQIKFHILNQHYVITLLGLLICKQE